MAPSSAFQCLRMSSSAAAWALARSSGESLARLYGLSSGGLSRPFQPVRSLPLNSATNPAGGVLSWVPVGCVVGGFNPDSVGLGGAGLAAGLAAGWARAV